MKVLSLFDGISCGMVALERAGISVERYVAYEIDENAIKVSKHNYPFIEHRGDVTNADFSEYIGFDAVIAGFPCQDLSINKRDRKGLNGERSGLFWVLVKALQIIKPKWFLIENNHKMPESDKKIISETIGVDPVLVNSSSVSAQSRWRLYWTNIPLIYPFSDKRLCVKDILCFDAKEDNLIDEVRFNGKENEKAYCNKTKRIGTIGNGGQGERVYSIYGKSTNLTANGGGRGAKTGLYLIGDCVRKLTPIEAERLQTLPDNYTDCVVASGKRIGLCGNGWTVDVIAHIFKGLVQV